jgi:menaquinol-cytochrome c reductase iron-sulfur subunit
MSSRGWLQKEHIGAEECDRSLEDGMTGSDRLTRRELFLKIGLLFGSLVSTMVAVPIVGYVLSPLVHDRKARVGSWLSLGSLDQFPTGETRLATYRNPGVNAWDGETANIACWVRRVDSGTFQVFATNCAHLGCPVRWFKQSGLFMCPCHGGAYYADGSRASGPPERGLFEYPSRVDDGTLLIRAGEMPTPGRPPCA